MRPWPRDSSGMAATSRSTGRGCEGKLGVNVGAFVGHCAVRRMVMGDDASEREATAEEIAAMQELVREAMAQGAIGLSTSQLDLHVSEDGRGVPSNHASADEVIALCSVLAEFPYGAIEIIARTHTQGYDEADRAMLLEMARVSGKPIELGPIGPVGEHATGWSETIDFVNSAQKQGLRLHPQSATQKDRAPHAAQRHLHVRRASDVVRNAGASAGRGVSRSSAIRKCARRCVTSSRLSRELDGDSARDLRGRARRDKEENKSLLGQAQSQESWRRTAIPGDVVDVLLDVSLREDLNVSWTTRMTEEAVEVRVKWGRLRHPARAAHRERVERRRSPSRHLRRSGLHDEADHRLRPRRAVPRAGDLSPDGHAGERSTAWSIAARCASAPRRTLRSSTSITSRRVTTRWSPTSRLDTERWFVDAKGYEAVIVNGVVVMDGGKHTGALPGQVLNGA